MQAVACCSLSRRRDLTQQSNHLSPLEVPTKPCRVLQQVEEAKKNYLPDTTPSEDLKTDAADLANQKYGSRVVSSLLSLPSFQQSFIEAVLLSQVLFCSKRHLGNRQRLQPLTQSSLARLTPAQ